MFRTLGLVAATAFFAVARAQNYSTSGPLSIDPTQIDPIELNTWCNAEKVTCPQICGGSTDANSCDQTTLNYTCVCGDGTTPNVSDYTQTLPFYVCQQWVINCVANHPNDLDGIAGCHSVKCGSKNASENAVSSTTASGSSPTGSSPSGGASNSPSGSSSASATPSQTGAAIALNVAQNYGTGIVAGSLLALFGLAL